jgi:ABC-type transporter MlaC component/cell division septation protein DedD
VFALALLVSVSATGVWAGEPTDTMRDFFGAVNLALTDPRTEDQPAEKLKAIRRHVDEVLDVREAAMLALGREWTARTAAEQNEFVALFADLLERSFVWRVAGKASIAGGVKVQYLGETVTGDTATVDTAVSARDGNDLRLEYRMLRRADRWVVRDVVMDGVSTMDSYHAQLQRVVRDGSWPELMSQLRAKVGAPPVGVQVAAPAPAPGPLTPSPTPLAAPLAPLDLDRPASDERHLSARDLAAVVTPGLAVRDVSSLPGRQRTPAPATEPATPTAREVPATPPLDVGSGDAAVEAPRPAEPANVPRPSIGSAAAPRLQVVASSSTALSRHSTFWIQVGAFRNATIAGRIAERVRGQIFVVAKEGPAAGRGEPLLRVRVGPFKDRGQVVTRLRELKALGYQPFVATSN